MTALLTISPLTMLKQLVLFSHVILFAVAMAMVAMEDARFLSSRRLDVPLLRTKAAIIVCVLSALWVSGLALIVMDIGADVSLLLQKPKLLMKIAVVSVVTLNGVILHTKIFPMLENARGNEARAATLAVIFGAISTTSWIYASFVGIARVVSPYFTFADFAILYAILVLAGVAVALLVVRRRVLLMLRANAESDPAPVPATPQVDTHAMLAAYRDAVDVILALERRNASLNAAERGALRSLTETYDEIFPGSAGDRPKRRFSRS